MLHATNPLTQLDNKQQPPVSPQRLKMERRLSNASESSIEPMDLHHTPGKKFDSGHFTNTNSTINESEGDQPMTTTNSYHHLQNQHKISHRRSSSRSLSNDSSVSNLNNNSSSKRYVQIDTSANTDNPLKKKFKISSSTPHRNLNNNNYAVEPVSRNESGFVDASQNHISSSISSTSSSSSSSSSPLSQTASPETSINPNQRAEMKYICPICEEVSATPRDFTNHIRGHNNENGDNDNFTCKICGKVLSSASSLDRHVLVHTGERPFNCKYCAQTFTTNGNMNRHMRTHKQHPYYQSRKNAHPAQNNNSYLMPHPPNNTDHLNGNRRDCYESDGGSTDSSIGSRASNNNNLLEVNSNIKRKNSDCLENDLKQRKIRTINNNILHDYKSSPKLECPYCEQEDFVNYVELTFHMDSDHTDVAAKCRYCDVTFKSHKQLLGHKCQQTITKGFTDLTFIDFSSEKFPLIAKSACEQTMRTPVANQKFECSRCSRAFPCATSVEIHFKECSKSHLYDLSLAWKKRSSESSAADADGEDYASDEENKRSKFFAHLDLRTTASTRREESFSPKPSDQADLKEHNEARTPPHQSIGYHTIHSVESNDLADIQSILNVTSSSTSNFLRNFDKSVNSSGGSSYNYNEEEEAQDVFTAEFRKMKLRGEFPCKLCTAVYPNLRALKGHNRVHLTAAGAGPFRCNMCPYSINDKAALIRHMRTHNGDRPYECGVCNYAFTTKANCERHLRNRHGKTTRDDVKAALIYHPSEDSNCDESMKKSIFSSPDRFDHHDEMLLMMPPSDRSTPVSHLKEILQTESKTPTSSNVKIQVKSLEKLIDNVSTKEHSNSFSSNFNDKDTLTAHIKKENCVDMNMQVLDLSKKTTSEDTSLKEESKTPPLNVPPTDMTSILLAQQQILNKIDPLYQQFYRSIMFNPFLFGAGGDFQKLAPFLTPMFAAVAAQQQQQQHQQQQQQQNECQQNSSSMPTTKPIFHDETPNAPMVQVPPLSQHQSQPPPSIPMSSSSPAISTNSMSPGAVKMVIKNGVLMPKQKQRRYRTERPFACEHCSARFTLRSNMERHIKQQHPQFWAQRQRNGHHIMRGRSMMPAIPPPHSPQPSNGVISDEVRYAILAQQLKSRKDTSDILQQALAHGSSSVQQQMHQHHHQNSGVPQQDDDEPKLVIDEDDGEFDDDEEEDLDVVDENHQHYETAKKVANAILEQSIKQEPPTAADMERIAHLKMASNLLAHAESVGKSLKDVAISAFKEEPKDIVPVSKLIDSTVDSYCRNASMPTNYAVVCDTANQMEQSDEEGLVASGSASESNHSGAEENSLQALDPKKKSAYSLAPNRVQCPYCNRMFPWSSSLRRHILTHTGQKPFKCSHCPLLFTTKSNCDRHLLRKHGNVESAMSLYVPMEDNTDPLPLPKSVEEIERQAQYERQKEKEREKEMQIMSIPLSLPRGPMPLPPMNHQENLIPQLSTSSSDLPFKCHLCDNSFSERMQCLDHIKNIHAQQYVLLLDKGAIDTEADPNQVHSTGEDDSHGNAGKYPDYSNRKVICAFCVRRFWSTEDLRRHMRTHSGERPFQCEICLRRFTLKHSMLRHMKKHSGMNVSMSLQQHQPQNNNSHKNSGSDISDDEQPSILSNQLRAQKIQELLSLGRSFPSLHNNNNSDLIGNLLGISDQGILNKLLSSSTADEAAKFLGVEK